jgi:hypothetical protein
MKRLIIICLAIGLLMGCASTFKMVIEEVPGQPGKIRTLQASDCAVKYNVNTGQVTLVPNRWLNLKDFTDVIKVADLFK